MTKGGSIYRVEYMPMVYPPLLNPHQLERPRHGAGYNLWCGTRLGKVEKENSV